MKPTRKNAKTFRSVALPILSAILLATHSAPAQTQCVITNGVKFVNPPNVDSGWDVLDSRGIVLADDFLCTNSGPITDIHLWGSWLSDNVGVISNFWIGIYDDVPAVPGQSPSHPGTNLLWSQLFGPGQFTANPYGTGHEQFFNPSTTNFAGTDTTTWYYCFYPTNPFPQQGTVAKPTNYWLAVYVQLDPQAPPRYGWKTSLLQYNDAAVWGNWLATGGQPVGNWTPMYDPTTQKQLDLAFLLTTPTNQTQVCAETNGTKYVQWPNTNGIDVWDNGPWVLADDFVCRTNGPITDIHLWGSFLADQTDPNLTFWLAIYDDVQPGPADPFSHPGNLLWQEQFGPGQYIQTFWTSGDEVFLNPGPPPTIMGPDTKVWYYCFYPTNIFVQKGSPQFPSNYWLMVYSQLPVGSVANFGWKTTTNVQHDISVHAPWPGAPPPVNPGWQPTYEFTGNQNPLDLSFKITTRTNCLMPFTCAADKTVECGSPWVFDPPVPGPDTCCSTATVSLVTTTTNVLTPCTNVISAVWRISDCVGNLAFCTQNVSVVDTTPPVITCPPNKTVQCGSPWTFDSPFASDNCCLASVVIYSTFTNSSLCPQFITRTWEARDCCGLSNLCSQTVTVVDTNPPSLICPTNMTVTTCNTNVQVFWFLSATDQCSSVTVTSSPPSGTFFLPNTTNIVSVVARDACTNTNTCSFTVTVLRPVLGSLTINLTNTNTAIVIHWSEGILQHSLMVTGTYVDVPGASPPTYTTPVTNAARFYRLRCNSP